MPKTLSSANADKLQYLDIGNISEGKEFVLNDEEISGTIVKAMKDGTIIVANAKIEDKKEKPIIRVFKVDEEKKSCTCINDFVIEEGITCLELLSDDNTIVYGTNKSAIYNDSRERPIVFLDVKTGAKTVLTVTVEPRGIQFPSAIMRINTGVFKGWPILFVQIGSQLQVFRLSDIFSDTRVSPLISQPVLYGFVGLLLSALSAILYSPQLRYVMFM